MPRNVTPNSISEMEPQKLISPTFLFAMVTPTSLVQEDVPQPLSLSQGNVIEYYGKGGGTGPSGPSADMLREYIETVLAQGNRPLLESLSADV